MFSGYNMVIKPVLKMDFIFSRLFILVCIAAVTSTSASGCEVTNNFGKCNYVVKCEKFATSISNPNCDREPNVTFILTKSTVNYLNAGFFSATNFDSRVRYIKFTNNEWVRIDGSAFRYYAKCIHLDLQNNKLEIISAEAFRNMENMKHLNLSGNNIVSFNPKSFYMSDSKNSDLKELDLSHNKLEYIGSELNEVPRLTTLYLQNNRLSSVADDAFMNLKNLSQLYLQNNFISTLNLSLIHLQNLKILYISNNHLIKLAEYELNRLVSLVYFNASHNKLAFVDSNCFNRAINLQSVDFSYNDITINIDSFMFINNFELKYLDFYKNRIFGLNDGVFKNFHLSYLNFKENNITGDITEETFSNLQNITELDLSMQRITGINNNAFSDMESLRYLNLSRNIIDKVGYKSFLNTSINILDLSHNNISNLNFMKNCLASLVELYLNNNRITVLPNYILFNQTQLKKLDLSLNKIIQIYKFSLPLQNLQYLNILGNKINGNVKENTFSPARYLRFLDLSNFNITNIESFAFTNLPLLAKLNLSNNFIKDIDINNFNGVNNLYSLDMSYNNILNFQLNILSLLPNLKALHLSHNNITNVSRLFKSASKLTYLDLSHNNIRCVANLGANMFPNLTVLYLHNNKILQFNNPETNTLNSLIDLRLSSNSISEINLSYFKDLMSVDLSNNNLSYINHTLFENNEFLQALDVSRNKIKDLPPGTFRFMKNLKFLNLSSNSLTRLHYGSLKGLHKTEILDLSRNNIAQLDVDIFHECDELKTLIIDYNYIKTFDIERLILIALKKIRTLSLGGNPILCKEIVHNIKSINNSLYAIRQVIVTSVDKIYHEDNVHGIKCGDYTDYITTTAKLPTSASSMIDSSSNYLLLTVPALVSCSLLLVVFIAFVVFGYYTRVHKKHFLGLSSCMKYRHGNSINYTDSDLQIETIIGSN